MPRMFRRRLVRGFRGSARSRRDLIWRANINYNLAVASGGQQFSMRPSAGWENSEPTLVRVIGTLSWDYLSTLTGITAAQENAAMFAAILWGPNPYPYAGGGVIDPSSATHMQTEDVLWLQHSHIHFGYYDIETGTDDPVRQRGVAERVGPNMPIDIRAKRRVRNEYDDIWFAFRCKVNGADRDSTVNWNLRFLYEYPT